MVYQVKTHFLPKRLLNAVWVLIVGLFLVSAAHAQVGTKPAITNQPLDRLVLNNDNVTFRVGALSATTMSYKWYHNSNLVSGATASSYTLNPAQLSGGDAGFYQVEVINAAGSTLSRVARLTILASNDVPIANNDTYTTPQGVPLIIPAAGILDNDVDVYPGTLSALLVSNPSQGVLSLDIEGTFTFIPNLLYSGTDSFTYRTKDGGTTILEQNSSGGNKQEIRTDQKGAQSFRHGTAGGPPYSLKKVTLRLSKKAGQANNLNFSIGTGINAGPITGSGYAITMAGVSNTTQGVSFQNYDIVYNTPVGPLTAGTTYCLNLDNSPNGKDVWVEYAGSSTFSQGTYYKDGSDDSKDMRFEIHEETFSGIATVTINLTPVTVPLRFVSQQRTTNGIKLELSGPGASIYIFQASTNLTDWTPISTNFKASGNIVFTDTWTTNNVVRFYRAMIPAATNLQANVSGGGSVEIQPVQPGAQSFRHGTAGGSDYRISKIVFRVSKDSPNPNASLIFSLGTGNNLGAVAGSTFAITPASITNNTGGISFQSYEIVYPAPIGPFTAGTTYYLNFSTQSTNGEEYWLERSSGSSTYSRGTFYSTGIDLGRDIRFEIWGND